MKKKIYYGLIVFASCLLFVIISFGINYLSYGTLEIGKDFRTIQDSSKKIAEEIITQMQSRIPSGVLADFDEARYFKRGEEFTSLVKTAKTDLLAALLARASAQKYSVRLNLDDEQKKLLLNDLKRTTELYGEAALNAMEHIQGTMPPYTFSGEIGWASNEKNRKVNITLYLDKKDTLSHVASASDYYYTPEYISLYKSVNFFMIVIAVLGIIALFYLLFHLILFQLNKKKASLNHDDFIEKVKNFINAKSFVAASKMLERYHELDPDNPDVIALKTRLEIVIKNYDSNGDPKKAEAAIILIDASRKKINEGKMLEQNEKLALRRLPAHEAELVIEESQQIEKAGNSKKEIEMICISCESMLETGDIRKAKAEAEKQIRKMADVEGREKLKTIILELDKRMKENEKKFNEVLDLIAKESFGKAKTLLREIQVTDRTYPEAMALLEEIELSESTSVYKLKPEKTGKNLVIYKKEVIMFARPDREEPDVAIANGAISRDKHFKLVVVNSKVIGENHGTNGTTISGQQIEKAEIESGDVVNIAKVYQMTIYIARGENSDSSANSRVTAQRTMMDGDQDESISSTIKKNSSKGKKGVSGVFISASESNYIMLIKKVPNLFTTVGIVFDEAASLSFGLENEVAFLATPDGVQIVAPGKTIGYKGIKYIVE